MDAEKERKSIKKKIRKLRKEIKELEREEDFEKDLGKIQEVSKLKHSIRKLQYELRVNTMLSPENEEKRAKRVVAILNSIKDKENVEIIIFYNEGRKIKKKKVVFSHLLPNSKYFYVIDNGKNKRIKINRFVRVITNNNDLNEIIEEAIKNFEKEYSKNNDTDKNNELDINKIDVNNIDFDEIDFNEYNFNFISLEEHFNSLKESLEKNEITKQEYDKFIIFYNNLYEKWQEVKDNYPENDEDFFDDVISIEDIDDVEL